jgi:glycosyltransferase involved in cell wall biosynthesis
MKTIRKFTSFLYKKAFKCCSKVIFQNQDDLHTFVDHGYLSIEKTAHVYGSGVNMARFKYTEIPTPIVFLMIGRIIKEKGVFEYSKAARIVKEKFPQAKFLLIGGLDKSFGSIKSEDLFPYIEDESIEYLGEVSDVTYHLEKCRFFVLPTYYREGLPRTILEAMAIGRPIITTDWPGCRDAVKDGENGFLVKPMDVIKLAEKMIFLIENPIIAEQFAKKGYQFCKENFDVSIVNSEMLEIMNL